MLSVGSEIPFEVSFPLNIPTSPFLLRCELRIMYKGSGEGIRL